MDKSWTALNLTRIVVGVDPAATAHAKSDETGIIVAGRDAKGLAFVLADYSGKYAPTAWAEKTVQAYTTFQADRVVAEVNKGGDMVEAMLRSFDKRIAFRGVHATRNKQTRAEPIAALYEKGWVKHWRPLITLEEQLCSYIPGQSSKSPDRMDALVWALTDLMLHQNAPNTSNIWRS